MEGGWAPRLGGAEMIPLVVLALALGGMAVLGLFALMPPDYDPA